MILVKEFLNAAENGDLQAITQYLVENPDLNVTDHSGRTALHFAAENNHDAVIAQLVAAGANVNSVDKYRRTALYLAAGKGNTEAIKALLSANADRDIKNLNEWTPLHLAVDRRYPEIVALLATPTTVNAVNSLGWTPLHLAVFNNNPEIAAQLIAAQADVTLVTQEEQSMLEMAVIKGNTTLVALLLAAKADVNAKGPHGRTALHCAAIKGDTAVMAQLMATNPDMTIVDNDGFSAFYLAALNGNKEIAEQLITAKEFFTLSENARFLRNVLTVNLVGQLCIIPERMLNYSGLLDTVLSKKDFINYLKTEQCQKDLALYKADVKRFMQKPMEYLMIQLHGFFNEFYIAASHQPTEIFQDPENVLRNSVAQAACDSAAQLRHGKTQAQIDLAYNAFYAYFGSIEFEADLQEISRYPFGEGLISTYTKQATPEQRMKLLKRAILGDAGSLGYIARMLTPDVSVEVATQFKNTAGLVWLAIQDVEHLESVKYLKEFADSANIEIPPEQIEEALQEARFTLWKGMVKIQYEHLETLEVSRTYPASKGSVHLHHLSIIDGLVDHAGISASMCKETETQEVGLTPPVPTYLTTEPAATQPPQTMGLSSSSVPQMDRITPS